MKRNKIRSFNISNIKSILKLKKKNRHFNCTFHFSLRVSYQHCLVLPLPPSSSRKFCFLCRRCHREPRRHHRSCKFFISLMLFDVTFVTNTVMNQWYYQWIILFMIPFFTVFSFLSVSRFRMCFILNKILCILQCLISLSLSRKVKCSTWGFQNNFELGNE